MEPNFLLSERELRKKDMFDAYLYTNEGSIFIGDPRKELFEVSITFLRSLRGRMRAHPFDDEAHQVCGEEGLSIYGEEDKRKNFEIVYAENVMEPTTTISRETIEITEVPKSDISPHISIPSRKYETRPPYIFRGEELQIYPVQLELRTNPFYTVDISGKYEGPYYTIFDEEFKLWKECTLISNYPECERIKNNNCVTLSPQFQHVEVVTREKCYFAAQQFMSYWEWIVDVIPRHYVAKKLGGGKIITPLRADIDELGLWDILHRDLIFTQGYTNLLQDCTFVSIPSRGDSFLPSEVVLECYDELRKKFSPSSTSKVYLVSERVANQNQLISKLTKLGFDIIYSSRLDADKVSKLSSASVLVSTEENLCNLLLCPPGCKAIQIVEDPVPSLLPYGLSCMKGFDHIYLPTPKVNGRLIVNVAQMEKLLTL